MKPIVISYAAFMLIWTMRILLLKPWIDASLGVWERQTVNGLLKLIVWCGMAVFLICRHKVEISLRDMFRKNFSWHVLGIATLAAVVFHLVILLVQRGGVYLQPFHPSQLISQFFVVGITEELLFRGWFYNSLRGIATPVKANILSSALFVTSHYPSYLVSGMGAGNIIYLSSVIFLMGLLFGYLFDRTKNILVPAIFHSVWDLLQLLVIG